MTEKSQVNFKSEPARYICNEAFFAVRRIFPESWNNRAIAFTEGALAGYLCAELATHISPSNNLEEIAKAGLVTSLTVSIGPYIIAPKKVGEWKKEQPVYSSGILGILVGSSIRALQQLYL